jgi:hypothetical protein
VDQVDADLFTVRRAYMLGAEEVQDPRPRGFWMQGRILVWFLASKMSSEIFQGD